MLQGRQVHRTDNNMNVSGEVAVKASTIEHLLVLYHHRHGPPGGLTPNITPKALTVKTYAPTERRNRGGHAYRVP